MLILLALSLISFVLIGIGILYKYIRHNMKPKYFYDCPLEASYMAKHFGIKLLLNCEDSYMLLANSEVPLGIANTFHDGKVKFAVAPESEIIFKPQEDDVAWSWQGSKAFLMYLHFLSDGFWQTSSGKSDTCTSSTEPSNEWIIIERQGKHFFMPKSYDGNRKAN